MSAYSDDESSVPDTASTASHNPVDAHVGPIEESPEDGDEFVVVERTLGYDEDDDEDEQMGTVESMKRLAHLLSHTMEDMGAWHPGDIAIGLYYLKRHRLKSRVVTIEHAFYDEQLVATGQHYAALASAAYGRKAAVISARAKACGGYLEESDIVKYERCAGITRPAYFLATDPHRREIIISVRGTSNTSDMLTDMAAGTHEIEGGYAHRGIFASATFLLEKLRKRLKRLAEENEGYNVVLTGHSLGASTAVLLCGFLREDYPTATAVVFAPPPCLCLELADACKAYVTSFILDNDMVPCFCMASLERLREDLYEYPWWEEFKADMRCGLDRMRQNITGNRAAVAVSSSKFGVAVGKAVSATSSGVAKGTTKMADLVRKAVKKKKATPQIDVEAVALEDMAEAQEELARAASPKAQVKPKKFRRKTNPPRDLFPPGRLLHIFRAEDKFYMAQVSQPTFFSVPLHDTMFADHRMNPRKGIGYVQALAALTSLSKSDSPMTPKHEMADDYDVQALSDSSVEE